MFFFPFAASKTVAFWDMDDCPIPDGLDALTFRKNINTALWKQGFEGGVDITAFGDFCKTETSKDFSRPNQDLSLSQDGGERNQTYQDFSILSMPGNWQ